MVQQQREQPFIIWTLRRTGGTSLRRVLYWLSSFGAWDDEAFNEERQFGSITKSFLGNRDFLQLESEVKKIVAERKNLKHCIEVVPYEVNSALLRSSLEHDYRHVVLLRANEVDRQISLEIARQSGAWGPDEATSIFSRVKERQIELKPLNIDVIRQQMERDATALGRLVRLLHANRVAYSLVFFEDFYTGSLQQRVSKMQELCETLALANAANEPPEAFQGSLMDRDQGTKEIYPFVPNIDAGRELVESYTR
jgi:hypothetical protein